MFASDNSVPVSVDNAWRAIRKSAGFDGLQLHDLRHTYAAVAVAGGEGLRIVAGMLGDADIKTTFGYAHLAEATVSDAANRVSLTRLTATGPTMAERVRLYDLRHCFASHADMNGESLHMTERLLGHRRMTTTNRYAHLDEAARLRSVWRRLSRCS